MDFNIEICSVANGATKKEIGRAKEYIVKQLELEKGQSVEMGTIHAGDFMVCVSFLSLSKHFILLSLPYTQHLSFLFFN